MTTGDLLRNLSIATALLNALRRDPSGEDAQKHIEAALHVVGLVRDELEQRGTEPVADDWQLELGWES